MPIERSPPRSPKSVEEPKHCSTPSLQSCKRPRESDSPPALTTSTEISQSMLAEILQTVRTTQETVSQTQADLQILTQKFRDIEAAVEYNSSDIAELRAENVTLRENNTQMKSRVAQIEEDLASVKTMVKREAVLRDDNENNSRKYNLEFSGVPKDTDEQRDMPKKYVADIMKLMGSQNTVSAIDVAHRKMAGSIIARFNTRAQRDEVYEKRFALKDITSIDLGFNVPVKGNPIYVNESLTFERSKIMAEIRKKLRLLNEGRDKSTRLKSKSSVGRLLVMKTNREYAPITSLEDFHKLHPTTREY